MRAGVGAVGIAVLAVATPACTSGSNEASTGPVSTVAEPKPVTRTSCVTAVPADWQKVIDDSAVTTGGRSNVPGAVGRRGEMTVARDDGDSRDLLLIGADKAVSKIYSVPEPSQNRVRAAAMDDRWVVVGVERAPRDANGVIPTLVRIDVLDRQGGSPRTVVHAAEDDVATGGKTIDSFALFGGKVYWITRDTYSGDTGTIRSYDLNTGVVTDVASGPMRNVRSTAAGLSWEVAWDPNTGTRIELKIPDALPPPVAGAVGTGRDQLTLTTDGNAYAWFTATDRGESGLSYWSPKSGHVRITGNMPPPWKFQPVPLYVVGPYVVIGEGRRDNRNDTYATVVDTRSGALTYLRQWVGGANGGTIGVGFGGTLKQLPTSAGPARVDALRPLSC